jgi:hypothetical protein
MMAGSGGYHGGSGAWGAWSSAGARPGSAGSGSSGGAGGGGAKLGRSPQQGAGPTVHGNDTLLMEDDPRLGQRGDDDE